MRLAARRNPGMAITFYPLCWRVGVWRTTDTVAIGFGPFAVVFCNSLSR